MKVDFLNDFKNIVKNNLEFSGYILPENQELENLMLYYLGIEKKSIKPKKRNAKLSKEIGEHDLAKYEHLINKIENGDDINPFLSKKIYRQDGLLNDWGIYHIHFKEEGTRELLFVYLNNEDAYFIDIMPHENSKSEEIIWANDRLIQILHDNWPEVLEPYKMNFPKQSDKITNKDRKILRKGRVNAMITTSDGTIYAPPGGGIVPSGHSIRSVHQVDYTLFIVKEVQKYLMKKLATKNIASLELTVLTLNNGCENYSALIKVVYTNEYQTGLILVNVNNGTTWLSEISTKLR